MNWIKTADRLPEDQAGLQVDAKEVLVSWAANGRRWYEVVVYEGGEYCRSGWGYESINHDIDCWAEITPPE